MFIVSCFLRFPGIFCFQRLFPPKGGQSDIGMHISKLFTEIYYDRSL